MPLFHSLTQIHQAIAAGESSCSKLVEYYLDKIEASKDLNAYVEVFAKDAMARAKALDAKYIQDPNSVGRLYGMVISVKDVLCIEGKEVTGASKILQGFTSLYTATSIQRLLDEDAIIIGRTNCDQFAMGSTNENSVYGPTRNAADKTKVPGGSSGGSAVAVQADTCLASIGSDTGGSVRQPAAFCGVIGLKPTYGRISRYGLLAYASSFDQIGVLSNSFYDAALLLEVMAGEDEMDATSSEENVPAYAQLLEKKPIAKKVAYFETALNHPSIDPEVKRLSYEMISQLKADGHEVAPVEFDYLDFIIPAYYVLTTAEASSNLSRYDGIRYGYRAEGAQDIEETYRRSRTEGFSDEVKRRIMLGTFVLSSGYYDAYYSKAQKVRRLIQERTMEIFKDYDFILMPVTTGPAWNIGETSDDPVAMYLSDIYTVQANMAGVPALAFPIDDHSSGLPLGIQFMAKPFAEAELLHFCASLKNIQ